MLTHLLIAGLALAAPSTGNRLVVAAATVHTEPEQQPEPNAAPARPIAEYAARELHGFAIHTDPAFTADESKAVLELLGADLAKVAEVVPPGALSIVRTVPIVVTRKTIARPGNAGRGACFHPSSEWLIANGYDAQRAGVVEIVSTEDYTAWRSIQPAMILHELAHAFHWLIGFDRADVREAFDCVAAGKTLYQAVGHVDGRTPDRAYALSNHHEYFAELSEAWFWSNDFYPFNREELKAYDPVGAGLIERLWTMDADALAREVDRVDARRAKEGSTP